jgi:hypothetical protein
MSVPFNPQIIALKSNADLSAKAWRAVIGNGDDDIDVSGAGGIVIGVLTDNVFDGTTTAQWNSVQYAGICKVVFAATAPAVGASLKSDANGAAVVGTTGDVCFGYALETAAAGDIGAFVFARHTCA